MLKLAIQIDEDKAPLEFEIRGDRASIGRSRDNDFRVKHSFVSAFHAEVRRSESGDYEIVDLDSFNGTFVNRLRVEREVIRPGDTIGLGSLKGKVLAVDQAVDDVSFSSEDGDETGSISPRPSSPSAKTATTPTRSTPSSDDRSEAGSQLQEKLGDLEKDNERLTEELRAAHKEAEDRTRRIEELEKEVSSARSEHSASDDEKTRAMREEIEDLSARVVGWKQKAEEANQTASRFPDLEKTAAEARAGHDQEKARADQLHQELEGLRKQLSKGEESALESSAALQTAEKTIADLQKSLQGAESDRETLTRSLEEARAQAADASGHLSKQNEEASQRIAELETEITRNRDDHAGQLQQLKESFEAEKAGLASQHESDLETRIAAVTDSLTQREDSLQSTEQELQALKAAQGKLTGEAASARQQAFNLEQKLAAQEANATQSLEKRDQRLQDLEEKLRKASGETKELREEKKELERTVKQLTKASEDSEKKLGKHQREFDRLQEDAKKALEELKANRREITTLTKSLTKAEANLEKHASKQDQSSAKLQEERDEALAGQKKFEAELAKARQEFANLESKLAQREREASLSASERDKELLETRKRLEASLAQYEKAETAREELEKALAESPSKPDGEAGDSAASGELADRVASLQSRLDAGVAMRAQTESQLRASRKQIAELEGEIEELKDTLASGGSIFQSPTTDVTSELEAELGTDSGSWGDDRAQARRLREEIAAETQRLEHLKAEQVATLTETETARAILTALRKEIGGSQDGSASRLDVGIDSSLVDSEMILSS